ncbi:hypothetical protein AAMO2058_000066600 [Amorphochlora amoebiformis]
MRARRTRKKKKGKTPPPPAPEAPEDSGNTSKFSNLYVKAMPNPKDSTMTLIFKCVVMFLIGLLSIAVVRMLWSVLLVGMASMRRSDVHMVPLLGPGECEKIVKASMQDDGWETSAFPYYQTRGRPLSSIESLGGKEYSQNLLQERIIPAIAHLYDVPTSRIRLEDLHIIEYKSGPHQDLPAGAPVPGPGIPIHQDSSSVTVDISLTPPSLYQGGATYFRVLNQSITTGAGVGFIHPGGVYHSEMDVMNGKRYSLVGFAEIEPKSSIDSNTWGRWVPCARVVKCAATEPESKDEEAGESEESDGDKGVYKSYRTLSCKTEGKMACRRVFEEIVWTQRQQFSEIFTQLNESEQTTYLVANGFGFVMMWGVFAMVASRFL